MSTPCDSHKAALMGLAVVTNRLLQKQKRPKELPWSETEHLIDEWIHSELDRQLLKEKLHNEDLTYEELAELHITSPQNVKKRFYRARKRLDTKIPG